MASYTVNTLAQQQEMLEKIGAESLDSLFTAVPDSLKLQRPLNLPLGKSEFAVAKKMKELASLNEVFSVILRGAGSEKHYIPSVVRQLSGREEFVTAYTPYQSELSQGILQTIFEFQTGICELTGMDASNASVYDGASAVAEAVNMTIDRKRTVVLLPDNLHPHTLTTVKTYTHWSNIELKTVKTLNGRIDVGSLNELLNETSACLVIQNPNFYGLIENVSELSAVVHAAGAKVIVSSNPMTLGVLKSPREAGADIAVGEAQPLGMSMAFGGPYLGYMATVTELVRRLPGRIVGQSLDLDGKRAFTLTLQAREQHIRREKASSSICSNQAHCALIAGMYLAALGPGGLREVAVQSSSKAHYLAEQLTSIGFKLRYDGPFFHEFVTDGPLTSVTVENALHKRGILSGLPLGENGMLWCCTETVSKHDIDRTILILKEVLA